MPRIALDAMGGDRAPEALVAGALRAASEHGVEVVLVGRPDLLSEALTAAGASAALAVVPASQVVGMGEDPATAVRAKPDASVRVAAQTVADGAADAFVSAGSTGATLAAALLSLGRIPGVRRPVVAALLPVASGRTPGVVLLDAGGSADVQPEALGDYARMGCAYAEALGVASPVFGLLNVGAERGKGNALARSSYALLDTHAGFAGNVEPDAALRGAVDVLVTDGFTGNVFLKTVEAIHRQVGGPRGDDASAAVLLGVRGEVLVAHGAADDHEVSTALLAAARVVDARLSRRIAERLSARGSRPAGTLTETPEPTV